MTFQILNAQIEKGDFLPRGSISFNRLNKDDRITTTFLILTSVGYAITKRIVASVGLTYVYNRFDFKPPSTFYDYNIYGVGMSGRYYFQSDKKLLPFAQISYSCLTQDFDNFNTYSYGGKVGVNYFLNEHVALEASLNKNSRTTDNFLDSSTDFGVGFMARF
jgi:hypothetical protein